MDSPKELHDVAGIHQHLEGLPGVLARDGLGRLSKIESHRGETKRIPFKKKLNPMGAFAGEKRDAAQRCGELGPADAGPVRVVANEHAFVLGEARFRKPREEDAFAKAKSEVVLAASEIEGCVAHDREASKLVENLAG